MQYSDGVFLEILGDETKATRQMMINWCVVGHTRFGANPSLLQRCAHCLLLLVARCRCRRLHNRLAWQLTPALPSAACSVCRRKVRVTPTFVIFRDGEKVHSHGGINETNLHRVRGWMEAA